MSAVDPEQSSFLSLELVKIFRRQENENTVVMELKYLCCLVLEPHLIHLQNELNQICES
jgi:hypothetical protein